MRKLITFILIVAVAVCAYYVYKEEAALRMEYPQYFDLDASNGLDIVVWQMARDSYSFGLLPHTDEIRKKTDEDLMNLKPVSAKQMRVILLSYMSDRPMIDIVIWQHPFSSYLPEDLMGHGGDGPFLAGAYKNKIIKMLITGKNPPSQVRNQNHAVFLR